MKDKKINNILEIMKNFIDKYDKTDATISFNVIDVQCIYYYIKYLEGISDIAIKYLNKENK